MEDQDKRTPEEEADVEGHALQDELSDELSFRGGDDDDVEAHALRDELADEVYRSDQRDELSDELA